MKNKLIKITLLTLTLIFIISALASCGDKGSSENSEQQKENTVDPFENVTLTGELWSLDYTAHPVEGFCLKKTTRNENGDIVEIHNYNLASQRREIFHYNADKLEYSETFEIFSPIHNDSDALVADTKLYETRYVYDGDKIVRGEVFLNGYPTRSYDEYEYTEEGKLKTVKRYDSGILVETYFYNGHKLPQRVETVMRTYVPEYDDKGNVVKATSSRSVVLSDELGNLTNLNENSTTHEEKYNYTIEYSEGFPSRMVWTSNGTARWTQREDIITLHANGALSEIKRNYSIFNMDGSLDHETLTDIFRYDEHGRETSHINSSNRTTTVIYDETGKLHSVVRETAIGDETTFYEYDAKGQISKKRFYDPNGAYVNTWYEFDEDGRVVRYVRVSNGEELGLSYQYYPNGNVKSLFEKMYSDGYSYDRSYAENGNMVRMEYSKDGDLLGYSEYIESDICYLFSRYSSYKVLTNNTTSYWLRTKNVHQDRIAEECEYEKFSLIKRSVWENDGSVLVMEYDANGKFIKQTKYDADGNVVN